MTIVDRQGNIISHKAKSNYDALKINSKSSMKGGFLSKQHLKNEAKDYAGGSLIDKK
jgi:hypothetical protein